MKRWILTILAALSGALVCSAQPVLKFNDSGEFKIVQFTDLHYDADKAESRIALKRMDEVIKAERPDLVIITGDLIYSSPASKAMRIVIGTVASRSVPFCTVFGNHDAQFDMTRAELYDLVRSFPGCVMPPRDGAPSPDYALPVMSSDSSSVAAVLYCIDSNAHVFDKQGRFTGYDCIHPEQVAWYCAQSEAFTSANGGKPLPSLAFFHIPLPEYHDAVACESAKLTGTRMEVACSPENNTGLFGEFKNHDDVFGVFVGHDHDNDYAVLWQDILLAYGRFTGGNTEYNHLSNGARVIVLKEGGKTLDTYIRLKGGEIINRISYPSTFYPADWRKRPLDPECSE